MTNWQPQAKPPVAHSSADYWHGVAQLVSHSNLEPTLGTRQVNAIPVSAQPALTMGASLAPVGGHGLTDGKTGR